MFDPTGRVRVHYINSDRAFRETKFGNMPNAASPVFALSQSREVQKNVTLMIAREANVGSGLDNLPALNYSCESAVEATTQLPPESLANLADSSTIWLTINEQRVTNTPNLGFDPTVPGDPASSLTRFLFYDVHIRHARQLSRSGLSMGVE